MTPESSKNNLLRSEETAGKSSGEVLRNFIETYRFDTLSIICDLVSQLDKGKSVFEAYQNWSPPDLAESVVDNHGSDCFGLVLELQTRLKLVGEEAQVLPFNTEGLPVEAEGLLGDVGHVGLFTWTEEGVRIYDPGFAVGNPIEINIDNPRYEHNSPDGRKFIYSVDFEAEEGRFEIFADYHDKKDFGFKLEPLNESSLAELQKRYFQIRGKYNFDQFDDGGNKDFGVKVNIVDEEVTLWSDNEKRKVRFTDWFKNREQFFDSLGETDFDSSDLSSKIDLVIRHAGQLRMILAPSLKKKSQKSLNLSVSHEMREWPELHQAGFNNGGVVALVANGDGKLAMYRIPETRQKPFIGRVKGQLNTVVETAEKSSGSDGVKAGLPVESFQENLNRGVAEELGVSLDSLTVDSESYREIPYGADEALARVVVLRVGDPEMINQFRFVEEVEGAVWQWRYVDDILGFDIEPNLRPILEYYIDQGLI